MSVKTGGWSEPRPASSEDDAIVHVVWPLVEKKLKSKFTAHKTLTVSNQVVTGMNYKFKVWAASDEKETVQYYVEVEVFGALPDWGAQTVSYSLRRASFELLHGK